MPSFVPPNARSSQMPVLLVDRDEVFRSALADALRIDGHEVVECGSGDHARRLIRRFPIRVLVSEFALSGWSGVALADELHAVCAGSTILVTTDSAGTALGFVQGRPYLQILTKPVAYGTLRDAIRDLGRDGPLRL